MDCINIKETGERIQKHRELAGYTREQLAELVDISFSFCSDIERGKSGLSIETLVKISKALNISCDYILIGNKHDNDISVIVELLSHCSKNELSHLEHIIHHVLAAAKEK